MAMPSREFEIHGDDGRGIVTYSPFILPNKERFSSLQAFNRYAGPAKWNYQQGFYIYRADRMIQSGGWCYMRTSDEHTKLARVALDFWPDLDSAFDLNVAKARVNLPAYLKHQLQSHIEQLTKQARKVYSPPSDDSPAPQPGAKGGSQPGSHTGGSPGRNTSPSGDTRHTASAGGSTGPGHSPTASRNGHIGRAIDEAASEAGETAALKRIRKALKSMNPETATEIGW